MEQYRRHETDLTRTPADQIRSWLHSVATSPSP
jgi:hypothetical protein